MSRSERDALRKVKIDLAWLHMEIRLRRLAEQAIAQKIAVYRATFPDERPTEITDFALDMRMKSVVE